MKPLSLTALGLLLAASVASAGEAGFSAKPAVTKDGEKAQIAFTVSAPTDVEVAVLDAGGRVVRHLAAGVLGGPPPEPLKAGLSQSVEWDMKDDAGKPAGGGPFRFRVRAGMRAELDGFVGESKYWVGHLCGIATDAKGNLYVYSSSVPVHRGSSRYIQVFDRDGRYLRTIMPMPADLPAEKLKAFGVIALAGGGFIPKNHYGTWPEFYPGPVGQVAPRTAPDGALVISNGLSMMRVAQDGTPADQALWRNLWPAGKDASPMPYGSLGPRHLTVSPDGKALYLTGFCNPLERGGGPEPKVDPNFPDGRVYRLDLTKPGSVLEKFADLPMSEDARAFCEVKTSGYNHQDYHVAQHPGLDRSDCDKDGSIVVADRRNGMVRSFSPDGKDLGGFKVECPANVVCHQKNGAVYVVTDKFVRSGAPAEKKLLKFSSAKSDAKLLAAYEPPVKSSTTYLAVDDSAEPPVVWLAMAPAGGHSLGGLRERVLLRIEDRGDRFEATANLMELNKDRFGVKPRMAVHPDTDLLICNDGFSSMNAYDGLTGKEVKLPFDVGTDMNVGLDGNWYLQNVDNTSSAYSGPICRYDRDMKPIPVPGASGKFPNQLGYASGRMGAGYSTMGVTADWRGRAYSLNMYAWASNPYVVAIFGPDGKPEDPGRMKGSPEMQKCTRFQSVVLGPSETKIGGVQLDFRGNIYVGMGAVPPGHKPPAGFENDAAYQGCVGAVIKFPPDGGAATRAKDEKVPDGKKGLVMRFRNGRFFFDNAVMAYPELGCLGGEFGDWCFCRTPMFQVDGWGRIFCPNAITCSVRVVDNAGNEIVKFGQYGNIDSRGPGADSLIKKPDVPLAWPQAVGASHKAVYVSDVANRRIVRLLKKYAAEETCDLK